MTREEKLAAKLNKPNAQTLVKSSICKHLIPAAQKSVINLTELCKPNHKHLSEIIDRTNANKLKAQADKEKQG